jgi:hypothetical protein
LDLLLLQLPVRDPGHLPPGRGLKPAQDLRDLLLADLLHHAQHSGAEKHLHNLIIFNLHRCARPFRLGGGGLGKILGGGAKFSRLGGGG